MSPCTSSGRPGRAAAAGPASGPGVYDWPSRFRDGRWGRGPGYAKLSVLVPIGQPGPEGLPAGPGGLHGPCRVRLT
jgi:hypothetical protein